MTGSPSSWESALKRYATAFWKPVNGSETCYYPAFGNVSENNKFSGNGSFGNPSNGDIGLSTAPHSPGNCFSGDSVPDGTDPAGIETNPAYQPSNGMCTNTNSGDQGVLAAQALCASQFHELH